MRTFTIIVVVMVAALAAFWLAQQYYETFGFPPARLKENGLAAAAWGQLGDFFGGTLNPIFGFLTLMAVLYTLTIQSDELKLSTAALTEQGNQLKIQAFENTFFSMLSMNAESVKGLEHAESGVSGRAVFKNVYESLASSYELQQQPGSARLDELDKLTNAYDFFIKINQKYIGHYLLSLSELLTFIESRCPSNVERADFYRIVRAQLTDYELVLIFYHSRMYQDSMSSQKLSEHDFFSYLAKDLLLNPDHERLD